MHLAFCPHFLVHLTSIFLYCPFITYFCIQCYYLHFTKSLVELQINSKCLNSTLIVIHVLMFHNYVELVIQLTHSLYRRCNSVPVLRWCHQHVSVRLTASPLNAEPHGV